LKIYNYNNNIFKILIQKVDLITSEVSSKCGKRNSQGIGFTMTGNNDNEAEYGGRIKSQKIKHFKIILLCIYDQNFLGWLLF